MNIGIYTLNSCSTIEHLKLKRLSLAPCVSKTKYMKIKFKKAAVSDSKKNSDHPTEIKRKIRATGGGGGGI